MPCVTFGWDRDPLEELVYDALMMALQIAEGLPRERSVIAA